MILTTAPKHNANSDEEQRIKRININCQGHEDDTTKNKKDTQKPLRKNQTMYKHDHNENAILWI